MSSLTTMHLFTLILQIFQVAMGRGVYVIHSVDLTLYMSAFQGISVNTGPHRVVKALTTDRSVILLS